MLKKIILYSILLLAVLALPVMAADLDHDVEFKPSNGNGKLAGNLVVNWQLPEGSDVTELTIKVSSNLGGTLESIPAKKVGTNGRTTGAYTIPINWGNTSDYGKTIPESTVFTVQVSAGGTELTTDHTVGDVTTPPAEGENLEEGQVVQDQDEGGWIDKMLAAPINGAVAALRALGLQDLDALLFNKGVEDYFIPPFIDQESGEVIDKWFDVFYYASFGLIILGVFYTGAKITLLAYTPKKREEAMKGLSRFVYAFIIIVAAPLMIQLFLDINNAGVDLVASIAGDMGVLEEFSSNSSIEGEGSSEGAGGSFITNLRTGHILTTAIVRLAMVVLMVYFNILYLIRALIVAGLLALTPILIWLWAITGNEIAIKIWFGEITSVIFMQFMHAFSILFFLSFTASLDLWWATVVALFLVIPFTNVLRNIFQGFLRFLGINEEGIAAGGMGMLGGLAAMGKATMRPGAGISGNSTFSPMSSGGQGSQGSAGGAFGVINAPESPQAHGSLATLSRMSPGISKAAGAIGAGVGMAMAAPLMGVNPGLASMVGNVGNKVTQGAVGIGARGMALGGMAAGNIMQAGGVAEGLKQTATIQTPIDPNKHQGYAGMTHETRAPGSTAEAVAGLTGAVISPNTAQGYNQGQTTQRNASETLRQLTNAGNKLADPMQWR